MSSSSGVILTVEDLVITLNPKIAISHASPRPGADSWLLTLKGVTHADAGGYLCQINSTPRIQKTFFVDIEGKCVIRNLFEAQFLKKILN